MFIDDKEDQNTKWNNADTNKTYVHTLRISRQSHVEDKAEETLLMGLTKEEIYADKVFRTLPIQLPNLDD